MSKKLKKVALLALITPVLTVLLIFVLLVAYAVSRPEEEKRRDALIEGTASLDEDKVWALIQDFKGDKPYIKDQKLCEFAKERLPQVVDFTYKKDWDAGLSDHEGFEAFGEKLFQYYAKNYRDPNKDFNFSYNENLSAHFTEEGTVKGWLESPSHRKTLDDDAKYSCVTCKGKFCVQLFVNY